MRYGLSALGIVWVDQAGQQHTILRQVEEPCVNMDDPDIGPTVFPIESYGQNETAQTSTRAQSDPRALLNYLDQFVDLEALKIDNQQLRDVLLQNQTEIEKAQVQVARIPDYKKLFANIQQQLKALESAHAQEVVALERKVAEERVIRENIERQVQQVTTQIKAQSVSGLLQGLQQAAQADQLKVGSAEYKKIVALAGAFQTRAKSVETDMPRQPRLSPWMSRRNWMLGGVASTKSCPRLRPSGRPCKPKAYGSIWRISRN